MKSAKWVDTTVGYRPISMLKMTVEMDGGQGVEFTATVELSDHDPAFGFYSRPSKASLVEIG